MTIHICMILSKALTLLLCIIIMTIIINGAICQISFRLLSLFKAHDTLNITSYRFHSDEGVYAYSAGLCAWQRACRQGELRGGAGHVRVREQRLLPVCRHHGATQAGRQPRHNWGLMGGGMVVDWFIFCLCIKGVDFGTCIAFTYNVLKSWNFCLQNCYGVTANTRQGKMWILKMSSY